MTAAEELASLRARLDLTLSERDKLIETMFVTDELLDSAEELLRLTDDKQPTTQALERLRLAAQRARGLAK